MTVLTGTVHVRNKARGPYLSNQLRGQDIEVVVRGEDGVEYLLPATELCLRVKARGRVEAVVHLDVHALDLEIVEATVRLGGLKAVGRKL